MNVTGFLTSLIQNFFGVPVGTQIRKKKDKGHRQEIQQLMERLVLISSIVEITTDDICIGSTPFYLEIAPEVDIEDPGTQNALEGYKEVIDELNSISKWVAFDLLAFGYSAYKVNMNEEEGKIYILPLLEENLTFFLTAEKKVKVFKGDELLEDVFLFINYSKRDLTQIKDKAIYKINPRPIQLANIGELARDLYITERSIVLYRRTVSRILRIAQVEVGVSQGANIQTVIDQASNAVNAWSGSFDMEAEEFDDEIPVNPIRNGKGKIVIDEFAPPFDIKDIKDLDYLLSKMFLLTRFPKTYADFTMSLGATAVSTIRGDIRYSRLLGTCRSLMETTANEELSNFSAIRDGLIKIKLTQIPTPEEDEVVSSLNSYAQVLKEQYAFIVNSSASEDEAMGKLTMYKALLGNSSNLESIQVWFNETKQVIENKFSGKNKVQITPISHYKANTKTYEMRQPKEENE